MLTTINEIVESTRSRHFRSGRKKKSFVMQFFSTLLFDIFRLNNYRGKKTTFRDRESQQGTKKGYSTNQLACNEQNNSYMPNWWTIR